MRGGAGPHWVQFWPDEPRAAALTFSLLAQFGYSPSGGRFPSFPVISPIPLLLFSAEVSIPRALLQIADLPAPFTGIYRDRLGSMERSNPGQTNPRCRCVAV